MAILKPKLERRATLTIKQIIIHLNNKALYVNASDIARKSNCESMQNDEFYHIFDTHWPILI